jgi:hypothetical protein
MNEGTEKDNMTPSTHGKVARRKSRNKLEAAQGPLALASIAGKQFSHTVRMRTWTCSNECVHIAPNGVTWLGGALADEAGDVSHW